MRNLTMLILLFFGQNVFSQANEKISIIHERDLTGAVTKIIYMDSATQQTIKEISVSDSDLNPYKNLNFPRITHPKFDYAYDLSMEDKHTIFNKFLSNSNFPVDELDKLSFSKAIVCPVVSEYQNYRVIEYNLFFENEENCPVGQNVSLVLLDSTGCIFKTIYNSNYQFDDIQLTNDHRFLAYWSTNPGDLWCYSSLPPNCAIIYDFELHKPIFIEQSTPEYTVHYPVLKEDFNYFVIRYNFNDGYQYNILFPHDRTMYSKFYTKSERERFVRYRPDGIVLKDSVKGEQLEPFKIMFSKTLFKEGGK